MIASADSAGVSTLTTERGARDSDAARCESRGANERHAIHSKLRGLLGGKISVGNFFGVRWQQIQRQNPNAATLAQRHAPIVSNAAMTRVLCFTRVILFYRRGQAAGVPSNGSVGVRLLVSRSRNFKLSTIACRYYGLVLESVRSMMLCLKCSFSDIEQLCSTKSLRLNVKILR